MCILRRSAYRFGWIDAPRTPCKECGEDWADPLGDTYRGRFDPPVIVRAVEENEKDD